MAGLSRDLADAPDEGYRPLSGLAVASAILGCISAIAIVTPAVLVFPLLGASIAVLALRELGKPDVVQIGRSAALVGLALSLGFAGQSVASTLLGNWLRERRVEESLNVFVDAVQDDRMSAVRTMLSPLLVPMPDAAEDAPAAKPDPAALDAGVRKIPAIAAIRACEAGGDTKATFDRHRADSKEAKEAWLATIAVAPCRGGRDLVIEVEMALMWEKKPGAWQEKWVIERLDIRSE